MLADQLEGRLESESRVCPLVADTGNRRMLQDWIDQHPSYESVTPADGIEEAEFDVCILDRAAFEEHREQVRAKKEERAPVLLPYLLLLPETESEVTNTDAGRLADNAVTETIDELVTLPIKQAELHWRLEALLRLREQSLELRSRERELDRQVALFEKAQEMAQIGAWEYDIEGDDGVWTTQVYRIHGLPEDTTQSPEVRLDQYHPEDRSTVEEAFETAVQEGEPYDLEVRLIDAEDTHRWVRTRGEPQSENGELTRVRGTIQDITERKERELARQRIEQAVESSAHAVYITDPEGRIEYVNPAFEEISGYTESDILGEMPRVLSSGEMSADYFERLWNTVRSGEVWEEETVNRRKNGETYTAMQTIAPVSDDGEIHAFVAVHEDITERKDREEMLKRRTDAIDEAPIGITISDPDEQDNPMIYVNDAFEETTGYRREAVLGENCRFLQGENTDPSRVARIREAIEAKEPISIELRNYRPDGVEFWNHLEIAPVRDDAGNVVNYIGFQQDVTARKERERQLDVIDRMLRHNVRNELNVIRTRAELIRSETSGEPAGSAEKIIDVSDRLVDMAEKERQISELLGEDPTQEEIDVAERLQDVASGVQADYPDAGIAVETPDSLTIEATKRFDQAIEELVTNAIVHNDSSSPAVTITASEEAAGVQIDIADTGPGIPGVERELLADQTEPTQMEHGSGFGLWLVKLIIARSGATVTIEDDSPVGTIVRIDLPG